MVMPLRPLVFFGEPSPLKPVANAGVFGVIGVVVDDFDRIEIGEGINLPVFHHLFLAADFKPVLEENLGGINAGDRGVDASVVIVELSFFVGFENFADDGVALAASADAGRDHLASLKSNECIVLHKMRDVF